MQRELQDILDDVDFQPRCRMWFMHDGAPAHFYLSVSRQLDREFGRYWIGREGPVSCSPRSPDLNLLVFCIWCHLKTIMYVEPFDTEEHALHRTEDACNQLRNAVGAFERIRQ